MECAFSVLSGRCDLLGSPECSMCLCGNSSTLLVGDLSVGHSGLMLVFISSNREALQEVSGW